MNKDFTIEALFKATGADQFSKDFDRATKGVEGFDTSTKKSTGGLKSFMGGVGKLAGAIGITKLVGKGFDMISDSVGSAVKRFDTLENSQKVFQNMGFEVGETEKMMDALVDSVTGLPTPMEDAVQGVQRLSSATGDLSGSEKIYSALNNGVLAFGGSNEEVNATVEMMSRGLQKGTINGQEFNSLMANMGPVINAVGEEMGYTSDELQKGLSDGSISVEDFTEALIDMDENGGAGMASLEKQARDMTGGIGTSMENVQNAINRGMATIIEKTNEVLESNGFPNIAEIIQKFGSAAESALETTAEWVGIGIQALFDFVDTLQEFYESNVEVFDAVEEVIQSAWESIQEVFQAIAEPLMEWWIENQEEVRETVETVWDAIKDTFLTVLEVIKDIVQTVFGGIAEFIEENQETIKTIIDTIWGAIQGIFEFYMNVFLPLVKGTWKAMSVVIELFMGVIMGVIETVMGIISGDWSKAWNGIKSIASAIWESIKTIVSTLVEAIRSVISEKIESARNTVSEKFEAIRSVINEKMEAGKTIVSNAVDRIKGFFDIDLYASGKAMINSVWDGVNAAKDRVLGKIRDVAGSIRDLWPFSPAKEGPLSDIHKMDFAGPIGDSIDNAENPIGKSMEALAGVAHDSFAMPTISFDTPTIDIAGKVANSNAQVKSAVSYEIGDNRGTQQSAHITLNMGPTVLEGFTDDITRVQDSGVNLELSYR